VAVRPSARWDEIICGRKKEKEKKGKKCDGMLFSPIQDPMPSFVVVRLVDMLGRSVEHTRVEMCRCGEVEGERFALPSVIVLSSCCLSEGSLSGSIVKLVIHHRM
jgi:hypothetical protein